MAGSNADLVRRLYAAWDEHGIEGIVPFLDPGFEGQQDPAFPGARSFHGHAGAREWDAWLAESFESRQVTVEQAIERGDRVLAIIDLRARGRGSGLETRARIAHLWTFRDGRAVHVRFYLDVAAAMDAAGPFD